MRKLTFLNIFHDERGIIFPYILSLLLLLTSYIVVTFNEQIYYYEQNQYALEQQNIQNLIHMTIHDFNQLKSSLDLSLEEQSTSFQYEFGHTMVKYQLLTEQIIQLRIFVYTENQPQDPFLQTLTVSV